MNSKHFLVLFALIVAATNVAANNVAASSGCTDDAAASTDSDGYHWWAKANQCKKGYNTWDTTWKGAFQTMSVDLRGAGADVVDGWQQAWTNMKSQFSVATGKGALVNAPTPTPKPTWNTEPTSGRFAQTNNKPQGSLYSPTATGNLQWARNPDHRFKSDDSEDSNSNPWAMPTTQVGTDGMCAPICTLAIGVKWNDGEFVPDLGLNDAPGGGFSNPGEKFMCFKSCVVGGGGYILRMQDSAGQQKLIEKSASVKKICDDHYSGCGSSFPQFLTYEVKILAMKEVRCINPNWRNAAQVHPGYGMWYYVDEDGDWHKDSPAEIFAQAIKEMNDKDSSMTMFDFGKDNKGNCLTLGAKAAGDSSTIGRDTRIGKGDNWNGKACWGFYQTADNSGVLGCANSPTVSPASLMECANGGPAYIRDHPNRAAAEMAYLRLCKPCMTTCKVRKSCRILGAKLTHVGTHQSVAGYEVDGGDGGSEVMGGLQHVAGTALCSNF